MYILHKVECERRKPQEPASSERLLEERAQMKRQVLKSLENGEVTFLKAAQMAGLSVWDFADLVREKGIVWIKDIRKIKICRLE